MTASVEIVIPWGGCCPHRVRALDWVRSRLATLPATVTVAAAPGGAWCKAAAVRPAVEASVADIVVVHDADVWTPDLEPAIRHVEAGAPWAVPHAGLFRLSEHATAAVLAGAEPDRGMELAERPYRGTTGGGIVVGWRELLERVPLDPRFTGWGGEDESWGIALTTMLGPAWRGTGALYHLWHPPQERMTRRWGSHASLRLRRRYGRANLNPAAMTTLLREVTG